MRWCKGLPRPASSVEVPYAKNREELKRLDEAALTLVFISTPQWQQEIGQICDKLDRDRRPGYSARECEYALAYQRICGLRSYSEARNRLASDRGRLARQLLGFDRPRETRIIFERKLLDGAPSSATISRHVKRFGERRPA